MPPPLAMAERLFTREGLSDSDVGQRHGAPYGPEEHFLSGASPINPNPPESTPACPRIHTGQTGQIRNKKPAKPYGYRGFLDFQG